MVAFGVLAECREIIVVLFHDLKVKRLGVDLPLKQYET